MLTGAILQLILFSVILGIIFGIPCTLILKKLSKVLSFRQAIWLFVGAYIISLAFLIVALFITGYLRIENRYIYMIWMFVFGYSMTKIGEKNYGIQNKGFPAIGAKVVFWLVVISWIVFAVIWAIYFLAGKL